jgi:hypothetical protein
MKKAATFYLIILLFACKQTNSNNGKNDASKESELELAKKEFESKEKGNTHENKH